MNYTAEDLAKIKQLVGTTDINNVRVGIQIAKGLGVTAETLASLFTIDDVVETVIDDTYKYWKLESYDQRNFSEISAKESYYLYKMNLLYFINKLLNE